MKKYLIVPLFIFIFIFPVFLTTATNAQSSDTVTFPKIDGSWSPGEWPSSVLHTYTFNNQLQVQFGYRINATDIIMTARYKDTTPSFYKKSCQSNIYTICSDGFAVGFDNNGDQVNMGTIRSPDDAIFVGIEGNYSIDAYMQGISSKSIVYDTEVGGVNNTYGRYTYDNNTQYFTFEMAKALKSGDTLGHDINLNNGSQINVMLAYWDNLPPRVEITGFSEWIPIRIIDPLTYKPSTVDYIFPLAIALVIVIIFAVIPLLTT